MSKNLIILVGDVKFLGWNNPGMPDWIIVPIHVLSWHPLDITPGHKCWAPLQRSSLFCHDMCLHKNTAMGELTQAGS